MTCSRSAFLRFALPGAAAVLALQPRFSFAAGDPTQLSGRYRYAGGRAQREKLDQAIEQVVSQLNFMIRGIARNRLQEGLAVRSSLEFDFSPSHATFRRPGIPLIRGPHNGSAIKWRNDKNEPVTIYLDLTGNTFKVRYKGDGSDSRYTYRFDDDGDRLNVRASIYHVRMPEKINYGLTYKRA